MSIYYNEETRIFNLNGGSFSYCLYVDTEGRLLNLYWGKRLPDSDLSYLLEGVWDGASFDLPQSRLPFELPTRGTGYYGLPAVCAENAEGNDTVVLKFKKYEIIAGKRPPQGLPQVYCESDSEAESLIITLEDELTGLTVDVRYTVFNALDALTRSMVLYNTSDRRLTLTHMLSASVPLYGKAYELIHLNGGWARERAVIRTPIGHAATRIESQRGASGHEHNPFIALCKPETTEFCGEAWAMTLLYSGSFVAAAEVSNFDNSRMSIGLNPEVCRWRLEPGARFDTPEALLVYSDNGLNGMSRRFHEVIRRRVVRGVWRDRPRPILINNWEATYFNFNEAKILNIARKAAEAGIELFVLDDGWFGKRNTDNCSLGDWVVNTEKLPGGIKGVAEQVNALGLKFGLWFEPEMISPDSDLYRAHPDWCLHIDGRPRTEARQQLILDVSRVEVQDYIINAVSSVLESAPISYVKWDMNRNMTEYFSAAAAPEGQLETQHKYMLGLYRVLEAITSKFPEVLFEGCSGGGGRFDAGFLYYMPQIWTSDDTDPIERLKIQYGTSFVYPPSAMGAHVSASPNHQTCRETSITTRAHVALSGNFGFELDLNQLTEAEFEEVKQVVALVKDVRGTLQKGEFTRLESPFGPGNYVAWQFISADRSEAFLCAFRVMAEPNQVCHRLYMKNLCETTVYTDTATGKRYTGGALMYAGLPVLRQRGDYNSMIFRFKSEA